MKRSFAERPLPFLALDAFGRALLILEGQSARGRSRSLAALTRSGTEAFRVELTEGEAGTVTAFPPALGADGRIFLGSGRKLLCFAQSGLRLWSLELPAALALPPATDGAGRPLLGLEDGSLLLLSPYGERIASLEPGSPASALGAFAVGSLRELGPAVTVPQPTVTVPQPAVTVPQPAMTVPQPTVTVPQPAVTVPPLASRPFGAAGLADGRLLLLGARGQILSELRPAQSATLSLASEGRLLFGLTASGLAYAISEAGELLWRSETGVSGGRLTLFGERLEVTGRGRAVSLSLEGEIFREAEIRNAASAALVSPSGLLFSAGEDWVLAAYRFERPLGEPLSSRAKAYGRDEGAFAEALLYEPELREAGRQLALLRDIENSLESGRIGSEEPRAAALASAIALGEGAGEYPEPERRFRGNPLPRARAALFLGRLGSPEAVEVLARVIRGDADSAVRAAALSALGAIAVDPEGESARVLLGLASRGRLPEELALALSEAIEGMALRSGSPLSAEAVRVLIKLSTEPYEASVRDRALRALGRMAEVQER